MFIESYTFGVKSRVLYFNICLMTELDIGSQDTNLAHRVEPIASTRLGFLSDIGTTTKPLTLNPKITNQVEKRILTHLNCTLRGKTRGSKVCMGICYKGTKNKHRLREL